MRNSKRKEKRNELSKKTHTHREKKKLFLPLQIDTVTRANHNFFLYIRSIWIDFNGGEIVMI